MVLNVQKGLRSRNDWTSSVWAPCMCPWPPPGKEGLRACLGLLLGALQPHSPCLLLCSLGALLSWTLHKGPHLHCHPYRAHHFLPVIPLTLTTRDRTVLTPTVHADHSNGKMQPFAGRHTASTWDTWDTHSGSPTFAHALSPPSEVSGSQTHAYALMGNECLSTHRP